MSKIRKIKGITIFDNEYIKKKDKDNEEIYNYLESRDFHNFVRYQQRIDNESYYPYLTDIQINKNQKGEDLINVVSLLHNKTSYNKEISHEKYKDIYDNLIGYVGYLDEYYYKLLEQYEIIEFPSPSQTIYITNYSKLLFLSDFLKKEINNWYALVKNKNKERLCLNHGNLSLEHMINDKNNRYLISWDKARFDSPILDIVDLYHNEWNNLEFSTILSKYLERCNLTEEEKKLLFINLAIPKKIKNYDDELLNVREVRLFYDYIYKTEDLLRPYYSEQKEK